MCDPTIGGGDQEPGVCTQYVSDRQRMTRILFSDGVMQLYGIVHMTLENVGCTRAISMQ